MGEEKVEWRTNEERGCLEVVVTAADGTVKIYNYLDWVESQPKEADNAAE